MTRILLHGCFGQMGQAIQKIALRTDGFEVAAGVDAKPEAAGFPVFGSLEGCNITADAVIDFSVAGAVPKLIDWCAEKNLPLVLCTTGLSGETAEQVRRVSEKLPIFQSANMSLGINFMVCLLERASAVLGEEGFNIEIIEKHHNQKTDAPSGTALMLANAMNTGGRYAYVTDRSQRREKRPADEIGISSVRGGSIVGGHSVLFAGQDEVIEISHSAYSRDIYAVGALKAAAFVARQKPGLYSMRDLINEK